jgi:DNA ligase-1
MKRFAQLFSEIDRTNRTNEKVAALERYFREAPAADAAWALQFLCGRGLERAIGSATLRAVAAEASGLAPWLIAECYSAVGDFAETVALILPVAESTLALALHEVVESRILPMRAGAQTARALLLQTWRELSREERFVFNKLITGSFRVGVAQTLVARALAQVAGVDQAVMSHRLMGDWKPSATDFGRIISANGGTTKDVAQPYPFYLASPLTGAVSALGDLKDWLAEWKWDGIRAQLIRRGGHTLLWSRGEEMVNEAFPEIAELGAALPDGTVLDGEILAWENETTQPFTRLQRRLGRKQVSTKTRGEFPVVFLAFDLLEWRGEDWRVRGLSERRDRLQEVVRELSQSKMARQNSNETPDLFLRSVSNSLAPVRLSAALHPASWEDLEAMRRDSRANHVEGIMLKRWSSSYAVGRPRGDWWKWKIEPFVIDAVLITAQLGHGRRASLFTDYTFGLWDRGELVPVAKAYSGLNDEEIAQVDRFVRANTADKFGPIRAVKPELVFELAFEAIQESKRHKSGIAVRFPRINRWRHDKKAADADTLDALRALLGAAR